MRLTVLLMLLGVLLIAGCPVDEPAEDVKGVVLKPAEQGSAELPSQTTEEADEPTAEESVDPLSTLQDLTEELLVAEPAPEASETSTQGEQPAADAAVGDTPGQPLDAAEVAEGAPPALTEPEQAGPPGLGSLDPEPELTPESLDLVGYWAVAASCHNGETQLNQRIDEYAYELDAVGNATLSIRQVDGLLLRLPAHCTVEADQLTFKFPFDEQGVGYKHQAHSANVRILTAADGTQLYLVRVDPTAPPAAPESSYESGTFTISFSGGDGFYIGSFAGGTGQLAVYAFGQFLVGEFERSEGNQSVNGYVLLELSPGGFAGPYWSRGSTGFKADWIGAN